jgi:hypothetical protein
MNVVTHAQPRFWPLLPWVAAALAAIVAPAMAMLLFVGGSTPSAVIAAPVLAVSLMGIGMIAAAAAGRFWLGVVLALLAGAGFMLFTRVLGMAPIAHPVWSGLAISIASISFSARGALFACSAADKGWWIAVGVVAGEAAILATAAALPDQLPIWLLALLPAQWASASFEIALAGAETGAASAELVALAGTAAATLVVVRLWPRRWPYLIMFTAWLGLSALVWHSAQTPVPRTAVAITADPALPIG